MQIASAQLEQATVINDFAIPKFDQQGRRLWILHGKELRRHGEGEATVLEMDLQIFAASRQDTPETRLLSPLGRFFFAGNRADGNQSIRAVGPDYEITGTGWNWSGDPRRLLIKQEVMAVFDATLTDFLASGNGCDPGEKDAAQPTELPLRPLPKEVGKTRIQSDQLELVTTEKDHRFLFIGEVRIIGRNLNVTCDRLEVISKRSPDKTSKPGAFGSISTILARGHVRIEQMERSAVAGKANIDVVAGTIELEDDPVVFDDRGKVTGHKIILFRGERRVVVQAGKPGQARPTVILPPIRDLGAVAKPKDKQKGAPPQRTPPPEDIPRRP